jgi:hypothetical protein
LPIAIGRVYIPWLKSPHHYPSISWRFLSWKLIIKKQNGVN